MGGSGKTSYTCTSSHPWYRYGKCWPTCPATENGHNSKPPFHVGFRGKAACQYCPPGRTCLSGSGKTEYTCSRSAPWYRYGKCWATCPDNPNGGSKCQFCPNMMTCKSNSGKTSYSCTSSSPWYRYGKCWTSCPAMDGGEDNEAAIPEPYSTPLGIPMLVGAGGIVVGAIVTLIASRRSVSVPENLLG